MKTLQEIEKDVARLASRVGADGRSLPTYGVSRDFGYPYVEVKDDQYHYVIEERGEEIKRQSSPDYDDLLYWIFRDITHGMAFSYELNNRAEDFDCRRIAFPKQIELMKWLGPQMGQRIEKEISEILRSYPYDDEPTKAVNRMRNKRDR